MSEGETRCPECGSWERQCVSDTPVKGCGCMRCASARIEELVVRLTEVKVELESARAERDRLREALREVDERVGRFEGAVSGLLLHCFHGSMAEGYFKDIKNAASAALAKAEGREP